LSPTDLVHPAPAPAALVARAVTLTRAAWGRASWAWVPVRLLAPRHRPRIEAHLLALDVHDRYLRFGYPASDEQIARYVAALDFGRDEIFGVFDHRLELIALAHLACTAHVGERGRNCAEFGVSVLASARGCGYGGRLFEHAVLHARNRGVHMLGIHALTENAPMLRIARRAGATVERIGSESEACLALPPENLLTHFGELVQTHAAEFDYRLKRNVRRVDALLESLAEVKASLNRAGASALE
jgi:GNAT superfamily N-acetyltransferase